MEYIVNSDQSKADFMRDMERLYDENKHLKIKVTLGRQRTIPQNSSAHLYFDQMAKALNDAGYSFTMFANQINTRGINVPWTRDLFKEYPWKLVQKAMFPETIVDDKVKTSKLSRDQVSKVYDVVNLKFIEISGVHQQWPEKENIK